MKYLLAALALVAAVAAFIFRPPQGERLFGSRLPGNGSEPKPGLGVGQSGPVMSVEAPAVTAGAVSRPRRNIVVYVAGDVAKPGVYTLWAGSRADAAVARAGGPKADADMVAVNLAALLEDGEEVAVPRIGERVNGMKARGTPRSRASSAAHRHRHRRGATDGQTAGASRAGDTAGDTDAGGSPSRRPAQSSIGLRSVDLNSADEDELAALPGIGPALAARIVAYREQNGPFASTDELGDVSGITPRLQDAMAGFVYVR